MAPLNTNQYLNAIYANLRAWTKRERSPIAPQATSVLQLRGLGKELWRGSTAADHVARERDSWGS